jgi:hypothetical protein
MLQICHVPIRSVFSLQTGAQCRKVSRTHYRTPDGRLQPIQSMRNAIRTPVRLISPPPGR